MEMPKCFYTKAFWIVVPLLAASMGSGVMAVNAQINLNTEYDHDQDKQIDHIRETLDNKITQMYGNQMIICEKIGANCK